MFYEVVQDEEFSPSPVLMSLIFSDIIIIIGSSFMYFYIMVAVGCGHQAAFLALSVNLIDLKSTS